MIDASASVQQASYNFLSFFGEISEKANVQDVKTHIVTDRIAEACIDAAEFSRKWLRKNVTARSDLLRRRRVKARGWSVTVTLGV